MTELQVRTKSGIAVHLTFDRAIELYDLSPDIAIHAYESDRIQTAYLPLGRLDVEVCNRG